MNLKIILIIINICLIFLSYNSFGQDWECGTSLIPPTEVQKSNNCSNTSTTYLDYYRKPGFWTPNPGSTIPIKTLRVNFVVVQKDDGTGTLIDDSYTHWRIQQLVDSINYKFSHSASKGYPSTCEVYIPPINDTRIRIELNDIIYLQNTNIYSNTGIYTPGSTTAALTAVHTAESSSVEAFNIILVDDNEPGYWGYYQNNALPGHDCIVSEGHHNADHLLYHLTIGHFVHEIGHALGLHHTYNGPEPLDVNDFDFLADVFGDCPEPLMMDPTNNCYPSNGSPCSPLADHVCYLKAPCFFNYYVNYIGDNPLMSGKYPANYISGLQSGRFHRALSLVDNTFVISNKNMHKYVIEMEPYVDNHVVASDQTWDFTIKMYQNIEILPGNTLTVTCEVLMPNNGKIIVHPGARLIIDGGTITNAHEGFWRGVQLYGDSDAQQTYTNQGTLIMSNGGTIEHAEIGVENWNHGDYLTTGGIIRVTNGIFRNNKRDVELMKFQNISTSGQYLNDLSYFTKTQFLWDDDLRINVPLPHVLMYKVSGVRFAGCTFADDRTNPTSRYLTTQTNNNTGIYSLDAKYYVKAKCNSTSINVNWSNCTGDLSSGNWTPTTFRNLDFGIYAANSHTENSILVDRSRFENNLYGILLVNSNDPVITQNEFEFIAGNNFEAANATQYGMHIVRSKGLRIEENDFTASAITNTNAGIVCSDLGESLEELYKNDFTNIRYAVMTQGKNRNYVGYLAPENGQKGLEFICNINSNNNYDHLVSGALWGIAELPNVNGDYLYGVKKQNASFSEPSGNDFTANGNAFEDYRNLSQNGVIYYYQLGNIAETPVQIEGNFSPSVTNNLNTCPSNLADLPIINIGTSKKDQLTLGFNIGSTSLTAKIDEFNEKVDGGNTANLVNEIRATTTETAADLQNSLIEISPYVSNLAIIEVVDLNVSVYSNTWLLDLILDNIHVARISSFITLLEQKENPFSNDAINTINEALISSDFSDLEKLESEISDANALRDFNADLIIRDFKSDTTQTDLDSIKYWIEKKNDVLAVVNLIDLEIQAGLLVTAQSRVNNLRSNITTYSSHLQDELLDVVSLKTKIIAIVGTPGGLADMGSAEHDFFTQMAATGTGIAQYQAQEILCFFYNECESRFVDLPTVGRSNLSGSEIIQNKTVNEASIKMYPNPAKNWVVFELPVDDYTYLIEVKDVNGRLIASQPTTKQHFILDTEKWSDGIYFIQVMNQDLGKLMSVDKLIIAH